MQDADKLRRAAILFAARAHSPKRKELKPMTHRIAASIARVFRANSQREEVHFHVDSDGRPFVCDYDRCESPALMPGELSPIGR